MQDVYRYQSFFSEVIDTIVSQRFTDCDQSQPELSKHPAIAMIEHKIMYRFCCVRSWGTKTEEDIP